ncbi:MAG: 16S rRNA (cytidine(1402)-2'-O)-methyltransferase [Nitrospirae bacterium]|nr:16S rRNA (cytidine(1402)-2'-O)-methyltransferase [Nitrospirota bacterium]
MTGSLYIVSTPIGNLEDITIRALRILKEASIIAAEDTRRTQKLCAFYGIGTPLTSYHDFNKEEKTAVLIKRMDEGQIIALVSDAGTPLISDPGYYLVSRTISHGLPVIPVPGASAPLAALTASGLPTDSFTFYGFLPRKSGARNTFLQSLQQHKETIIFFESPHRLPKTLQMLKESLGDRRIVITRELTKVYEEILRGTAEEILQVSQKRTWKGELTVVVEGEGKRPSGKKRKTTEN